MAGRQPSSITLIAGLIFVFFLVSLIFYSQHVVPSIKERKGIDRSFQIQTLETHFSSRLDELSKVIEKKIDNVQKILDKFDEKMAILIDRVDSSGARQNLQTQRIYGDKIINHDRGGKSHAIVGTNADGENMNGNFNSDDKKMVGIGNNKHEKKNDVGVDEDKLWRDGLATTLHRHPERYPFEVLGGAEHADLPEGAALMCGVHRPENKFDNVPPAEQPKPLPRPLDPRPYHGASEDTISLMKANSERVLALTKTNPPFRMFTYLSSLDKLVSGSIQYWGVWHSDVLKVFQDVLTHTSKVPRASKSNLHSSLGSSHSASYSGSSDGDDAGVNSGSSSRTEFSSNGGGEIEHRRPRVIDCGANIGFFTLYSLAMGAQVTSFEPLLDNVRMIANSVALNGWQERSLIFNNAVSFHGSILNLHRGKGNVGGTRVTDDKDVFEVNHATAAKGKHRSKGKGNTNYKNGEMGVSGGSSSRSKSRKGGVNLNINDNSNNDNEEEKEKEEGKGKDVDKKIDEAHGIKSVSAVLLDDIVGDLERNPIDLFKVDVEGFEMQVFQSAARRVFASAKTRPRYLLLEWSEQNKKSDSCNPFRFASWMKEMGYAVYDIMDPTKELNILDLASNLTGNFVFVLQGEKWPL